MLGYLIKLLRLKLILEIMTVGNYSKYIIFNILIISDKTAENL